MWGSMYMIKVIMEFIGVYGISVVMPIVITLGMVYWYYYDEIWLKLGEKQLEELESVADDESEDDDEDDLLSQ